MLPEPPAAQDAGALAPFRVAEPFERLREAAERTGARVFLAGPRSARLDFARETFEAAGVATVAGDGFDDIARLVEGFRSSGAALACLCGTDEDYGRHAESFAAALKGAGAKAVYLVGREAAWSGIDGFLYAGADLVAALEVALRAAGAGRAAPGLSAGSSP